MDKFENCELEAKHHAVLYSPRCPLCEIVALREENKRLIEEREWAMENDPKTPAEQAVIEAAKRWAKLYPSVSGEAVLSDAVAALEGRDAGDSE